MKSKGRPAVNKPNKKDRELLMKKMGETAFKTNAGTTVSGKIAKANKVSVRNLITN